MAVTLSLHSIDPAATWTANNPVLPLGAMGFEYDGGIVGKVKIGTGAHWSDTAYVRTEGVARGAIAAALVMAFNNDIIWQSIIAAKADASGLGTAAYANIGTDDGELASVPMPMKVMPNAKTVVDLIKLNDDPAAYRATSYFVTAEDFALLQSQFLSLLKWVILTFDQVPEGLELQIEPALSVE